MTRFPPKRILVPMDLSGPSFSALEAAKALSRRFRCPLEVLHIDDMSFSLPAGFPNGPVLEMPNIDKMRRELQDLFQARLRAATRGMPPGRLRVRSAWGRPAASLARIAQGGGADLVVMGTHGYAGWSRLLFGSVAEAVVRRAAVPVLAVHEHSKAPGSAPILAPYNMTPYADKTLVYAADAAKALGARLDVLYVGPGGENRRVLLEELRAHVAALLGKSRGGRVERVALGDPRAAILAMVRRGGYGMVVLSAHRRPFSSDIVIGGTVERVLRHCAIPVLAVPSGAPVRWQEIQLYAGGLPTSKVRLPV
jgi:nucleotide-binding universal stress UspA family protein